MFYFRIILILILIVSPHLYPHGNQETPLCEPVFNSQRETLLPSTFQEIPQKEKHQQSAQFHYAIHDESMLPVISAIKQIADTNRHIILTGPTGAGKTALGRIIHNNSFRKNAPFIVVGAGQLNLGTVDSSIFGHKSGSFTGASRENQGLLMAANGGTLMIDDVQLLPQEIQAKLLSFLDTFEFYPVGASRSQKVNVRLIASLNIPPEEAIAKGLLKPDFYHRLNEFTIEIPPIKTRPKDLHYFINYFLEKAIEDNGLNPELQFSEESKLWLLNYDWPGNVRQLQRVIQASALLAGEKNQGQQMKSLDGLFIADHLLRPDLIINNGYIEIHHIKRFIAQSVSEKIQKSSFDSSSIQIPELEFISMDIAKFLSQLVNHFIENSVPVRLAEDSFKYNIVSMIAKEVGYIEGSTKINNLGAIAKILKLNISTVRRILSDGQNNSQITSYIMSNEGTVDLLYSEFSNKIVDFKNLQIVFIKLMYKTAMIRAEGDKQKASEILGASYDTFVKRFYDLFPNLKKN